MVSAVSDEGEGEDVLIWNVDAFYDAPIGNGSAITAYAQFQSNNYGTDYVLGTTYGTGSMFYTQVGYLLPIKIKNYKFQPYGTFMSNRFNLDNLTKTEYKVGMNWFLGGHNCKLSFEYVNTRITSDFEETTNQIINAQAMIFL